MVLNLSRTEITDAGLKHLEGMTHLKLLFISETNVTAAGRKSLEKALPGLDIRPHR